MNEKEYKMVNLFERGKFTSNAGITLHYKIECDSLTEEDIATLAEIIGERTGFSKVISVPRGGDKLATALEKYEDIAYDTILIVDDVLTTGGSMERVKKQVMHDYSDEYDEIIGIVLFAREKCPDWITAVFQMWDND